MPKRLRAAVLAACGCGTVLAAVLIAQTDATGFVTGRVVDGVTRQPLGGVLVELHRLPDVEPDITPDLRACGADTSQLVETLLTSPNGTFTFLRVPAGVYELISTYPGWSDGSYGQRTWDGSGRWFTLADRQRRAGFEVPLWPTATLSGDVVDDRGAPVRRAPVEAVSSYPRWLRSEHTYTDDRGHFALGVEPGEYLVAALDWGLRDESVGGRAIDPQSILLKAYYPAAVTPDAAEPVVVGSGDLRDEIRITAVSTRAYRVVVRIANTSGALLALVVGKTGHVIAEERSNQVRSGQDSVFTFMLPAGDYGIRMLDGGAPAGELPISVTDRDVDLRVTPYGGSTVSGVVRFNGTRAPEFAGVRFGSRRETIYICDGGRSSFITAARPRQVPVGWFLTTPGSFSTEPFAPGRHWIDSAEDVVDGWQVESLVVDGRDVAGRFLDIGETDIRDAILTLTDRTARLSGRVISSEDRSFRPWVTIFPAERELWEVLEVDTRSRRVAYLRARADGTFATMLPQGAYFVAATDRPVAVVTIAQLTALAAQATSVWIGYGQTAVTVPVRPFTER